MHVSRRSFELCAITQVMQELKSGDLCIPGSDRYSDFREQFVSEEECRQGLASYGERAGIATEPRALIKALQNSSKNRPSRPIGVFQRTNTCESRTERQS